MEEWSPDININERIVKSYLQEQFPELSTIQSIQYLGEGWDNKIFLVNQSLIFRFPHRTESIKLMEHEEVLLNKLPTFPHIKTPQLKYVGSPTAQHPYPCQGYEMIKGQSGYLACLTEDDRRENITILAKFLKQLHGITESEARAMGVVPQGAGSRSNIVETINVLEDRVGKVVSKNILSVDMSCLKDEIIAIKDLTLPNEICFVHGDLDSRHLIFNEEKLTGIIDWGDADITSRAVDLDILWTFFPRDCHDQFFKIYGEVDANVWQYARFLGIYCGFSLALYANDLGDQPLFRESINSIMRINPGLLADT